MPHRRTVVWKLRRGNATSLADIGNPLALPTPDPKVPSTSYAPTSYSLCLYETPLRLPVPPNPATEKLIFGGTVPPGRTCGSQACWEKIGDRYHYRDGHGDPDGLTKIQIRPGTEGKTILIVKGRGPLLGNALGGMPTFPFTVPLVVQLQGSNGTCWEAIYKHPVITDSTAFTAEGSTFPPTPRATATLILFPTPFATLTAGASTASPTATSTPGSTGGPASATPTPLSTPEPTETVHGTSSATQTPVSSPTGTGPTHTPIGVTPSPISTGVTPSPISTPVSLPHLLDPELAKAANKCQRAIKTAGAFFAVKSPAALARCTDAVLRCIQTKPNDPTCIPKATATCQMALKSIGATRAALTTTIVRKCGLAPLVASDLIDAEGLGYGDLAGACLSLGTNLADSVSVADCLARQHACEAQQLFDAQQPRGGELLRRAGVPLDLNSCLPDRGDKGDMGDPRGTGKLLVECMTRMEKAASKFLATQLLALQTCVGGLFACVQTKPDDEACLAKAGETCVKDLVLIHAAGTKMSAAIDRKCRMDMLLQPACRRRRMFHEGRRLSAP